MRAELVVDALQMALARRRPGRGLRPSAEDRKWPGGFHAGGRRHAPAAPVTALY
jgi:hypothetical protein